MGNGLAAAVQNSFANFLQCTHFFENILHT